MTNSITRRGAEQWKIPLEGGAKHADCLRGKYVITQG